MNSNTPMVDANCRLGGLRRFALAITALNIVGHTYLGFEQSFAQPCVALIAAYATELLLETVDAWSTDRTPRYKGGISRVVDFLLSAHISGMACSMLIYANARLWPVAFAAIAAICSKAVFRVILDGKSRHFMNPSNFGIVLTLLLFPWVGITQPYQFTENVSGAGDLIVPGIIVLTGTFLNTRFTRRLPLVFGWLVGFVFQAVVRYAIYGTSLEATLVPMTGVVFVLYTFYMITDPATTPECPSRQLAFGFAVAVAYGILVTFHIVFGFYFALALVTASRGAILWFVAREHAVRWQKPSHDHDAKTIVLRFEPATDKLATSRE